MKAPPQYPTLFTLPTLALQPHGFPELIRVFGYWWRCNCKDNLNKMKLLLFHSDLQDKGREWLNKLAEI